MEEHGKRKEKLDRKEEYSEDVKGTFWNKAATKRRKPMGEGENDYTQNPQTNPKREDGAKN